MVCWDISRIGRSMKELILFLSDMKDRGVGICSVRQGFDTSTSMGEIMFQFVGILSSWEREMIRERTLAGLVRARREGSLSRTPPRTHPRNFLPRRPKKSSEGVIMEIKSLQYVYYVVHRIHEWFWHLHQSTTGATI